MYALNLLPDQIEKLKARAKAHGYSTLEDWLRALADNDIEDSTEEILAGIQQGFREALRGEGMSVKEFRRRMSEDD